MALIGLNNFWYTHLTEAADGTPSFDGAKNLGKAVNANLSVNANSAEVYADDSLQESDYAFNNGTLTLGVDDDRETTFADLLGHSVDAETGEVISSSDDVAPYVSVARIIVKMVNNVRLYQVVVLYKVKFSEPSEDNQTAGESLAFTTPSIEGKVSRLANGKWRIAKTFATKAEALAYIQGLFAAAGTTFRVGYDANGGTGSIATVSVNAGSSTTLAAGTSLTPPSNKEFAGWALTSGATTPAYQAGATFYPTGDTTFYAVYQDEEST